MPVMLRLERYNCRVQISGSRVVERMATDAPLYSTNVGHVDPKGTTHSREHVKVRYRLDRHATMQKATV